jgi:hypothetical protein
MPLPTRRAVRPDGKHIRDARRQSLYRSGHRRGARGFWGIVAILSLVGLIVSGSAEIFGAQHTWVMPTLYASAAGFVISLLALFM